jgi:hypothetical protein
MESAFAKALRKERPMWLQPVSKDRWEVVREVFWQEMQPTKGLVV